MQSVQQYWQKKKKVFSNTIQGNALTHFIWNWGITNLTLLEQPSSHLQRFSGSDYTEHIGLEVLRGLGNSSERKFLCFF